MEIKYNSTNIQQEYIFPPNGKCVYINNFIENDMDLLNCLYSKLPLSRKFGDFTMNRLACHVGDEKVKKLTFYGEFTYWNKELSYLKDILNYHFPNLNLNSCLVNFYKDELDWLEYHTDNTLGFGLNPQIITISLGAPRIFGLKNKKEQKRTFSLGNGDLFCMFGDLQSYWFHGIEKDSIKRGPRMNLTFRKAPIE